MDFSERYFMNLAKAEIGDDQIDNWRVDTIQRLNETGKFKNTNNTHSPKVGIKKLMGGEFNQKKEKMELSMALNTTGL